MPMDRVVQRVNDIADSGTSAQEKMTGYLAAILDSEIAELIRRDLADEPGLLRKQGFVDIADVLGRP